MSVTLSGDTGLTGAATGALNGTLGATTPNTVAATTVAATTINATTVNATTATANSLRANGSTSGSVTLSAPAVAGSTTQTLQAVTGTIALTGDVIGIGQTWQNMSTSRAWSTDYTNTTGRPIMFSVTNDALDCGIELYVGSVRIGTSGQVGGGGSDYNQMSAIVPNGAVYKAVPIRGAGTIYWAELR
jgi:hypothetical protein